MQFSETSLTSAQWFKTRFQILQILILIRYLRRLNFLIDELCSDFKFFIICDTNFIKNYFSMQASNHCGQFASNFGLGPR